MTPQPTAEEQELGSGQPLTTAQQGSSQCLSSWLHKYALIYFKPTLPRTLHASQDEAAVAPCAAARVGRPGATQPYCSGTGGFCVTNLTSTAWVSKFRWDVGRGQRNDDGRTRFCSTHKQEGHVNVTSKRCEADGCGKIPISAVRSTA